MNPRVVSAISCEAVELDIAERIRRGTPVAEAVGDVIGRLCEFALTHVQAVARAFPGDPTFRN